MNFLSSVKCICCLIKCSKYVYYIKKLICCAVIILAAVTGICFLSSNKCTLKKLKEML